MNWWDQYFGGDQRGKVPPLKLAFDRRNPRFTPDKSPHNSSDAAIVEYLDRTADLGELVKSIGASGYVDIEPLIAIGRGNELVVLEGNRRLAALKALLDPQLAHDANLSVPVLTSQVRATLDAITVFKVDAEEDARDLIGFKHINGPQGWNAYAKALFAARWLDEEVAKGGSGVSLTNIAARMGDNHDTLYRIVSAVYVLQQAEAEGLFSVEDRAKKNFSFSHLYTALTYVEYREFLGLGRADRSADPQRNPVAPQYFSNLRQLLIWLFGSRSERLEPAIKTQAPGLSELKKVLGHPVARKVMLERSDLSEALRLTFDGSERFGKALADARASLESATQEITNTGSDEDLVAIAADAFKRAEFIHRYLISTLPEGNGKGAADE